MNRELSCLSPAAGGKGRIKFAPCQHGAFVVTVMNFTSHWSSTDTTVAGLVGEAIRLISQQRRSISPIVGTRMIELCSASTVVQRTLSLLVAVAQESAIQNCFIYHGSLLIAKNEVQKPRVSAPRLDELSEELRNAISIEHEWFNTE